MHRSWTTFLCLVAVLFLVRSGYAAERAPSMFRPGAFHTRLEFGGGYATLGVDRGPTLPDTNASSAALAESTDFEFAPTRRLALSVHTEGYLMFGSRIAHEGYAPSSSLAMFGMTPASIVHQNVQARALATTLNFVAQYN